jgi:hypothetical protein
VHRVGGSSWWLRWLFGGSSYLAELVAVLFVLVHLVVRDSLAGHTAHLRFVFESHTLTRFPNPPGKTLQPVAVKVVVVNQTNE